MASSSSVYFSPSVKRSRQGVVEDAAVREVLLQGAVELENEFDQARAGNGAQLEFDLISAEIDAEHAHLVAHLEARRARRAPGRAGKLCPVMNTYCFSEKIGDFRKSALFS